MQTILMMVAPNCKIKVILTEKKKKKSSQNGHTSNHSPISTVFMLKVPSP